MYIEDERRASSLEDLTDRLLKAGGKVIGIIERGEEQGAIAQNGDNYFVLYPDGEYKTLSGYPAEAHFLKSGWSIRYLKPFTPIVPEGIDK